MKYYLIAVSLAVVMLTSCVSYSELLSSAKPQPGQKQELTRNCSFEVAPLIDERSKGYKTDRSQGWFAPVGLLFVLGWGNEGPVFTDSDKDNPKTVVTVLKKNVEDTIAESGYFSNNGKQYTVTLTLKQFYSVRWEKDETWFFYAASVERLYRMWPLGHISVLLQVTEKGSSRVIGERLVTRSFLYNPNVFSDESYSDIKIRQKGTSTNDLTLTELFRANQFNSHSGLPILAQAATGSIVMRDFLLELPVILDEIVANDTPVTGGAGEATMTVVRLCDDYRFQEVAVIDIDSGKVVSTDIKRRLFPIMSAPDQWIVVPVFKGHWMSDDDYARLLQRLSGKFSLDLKSNMNAAVINIKK